MRPGCVTRLLSITVPVRGARLVSGALVLTLLACAAAGQDRYVEQPGVFEFSGEMIVKPLASGSGSAASRASYQRALRAIDEYEVLDHDPDLDFFVIKVPTGEDENSVSRKLMRLGVFRFVEPNWRGFPLGCPNEDDPDDDSDHFDAQWHHEVIESCRAWDIHTGDPSTVIAFVDTGIRATHEDLALNRARGYDAVGRCWETLGTSCGVEPLSTKGTSGGNAGHGTGTTGAAVAAGNNGVGIVGVGWNLGHRMIRATGGHPINNDFCVPLFPVCHAVLTAAQAGDKVVSVQVGVFFTEAGTVLAAHLREEYDALLIWSAGNGGAGSDFGHRDADDLIVVGGTNRLDQSYGTTGRSVDLVAPAVDIHTTGAGADSGYVTATGTSYSAPIVAGLCGLIRSFDPGLTADEVEFLLKAGAVDLGRPGQDDTFGHGRINAYDSLRLAATKLGSGVCGTTPNSAGKGATFYPFGSRKVRDNDLWLRATGLPAGAPVRILVGSELAGTPLGEGQLCAGGRLVVLPPTLFADADGLLEHAIDLGLGQLDGLVVPGASTVLQVWYRDPAGGPAGVNLSNAVQVDWL